MCNLLTLASMGGMNLADVVRLLHILQEKDDPMTRTASGQDLRIATGDEALARAAHLYYVLGMTQAEVAARIGATRFKVNRMLSLARERGLVRIEINVPYTRRFNLERALEGTFALDTCFVCPSDSTPEVPLSVVIGNYAATAIGESIESGTVIATSWGQTLRSLALAINSDVARDLVVASMLGALTSQTDLDRFDAAATLASRLRAECLYIPGPIICDSEVTRDAIHSQPAAQRAMEQARNADLALLSVGGHGMSSLREASIITDDEYKSAVKAGAIGNFLGHFIDSSGKPVKHQLNERAVGVGPEGINNIPRRVLCAGGEHKIDAIRVVLERGYANGLVTDEKTAITLLEQKGTLPPS